MGERGDLCKVSEGVAVALVGSSDCVIARETRRGERGGG